MSLCLKRQTMQSLGLNRAAHITARAVPQAQTLPAARLSRVTKTDCAAVLVASHQSCTAKLRCVLAHASLEFEATHA